MNIKNLIFRIAAFFLIINAQVVYTKDSQDDNNKSQITTTSEHNDSLQNNEQYNEEIWKFVEETFQSVVDQTQKIEFSLQTIEQIINAGKIKFDNQTVSKAQLLQEIKYIKQIIAMISDFYTKQLSKDEAITRGTFFNTAFIQYLLPVFQNDITKINADDFDRIVAEKHDQLINDMQNINQLQDMVAVNEVNIQLLMTASENVGLSTFNKFYRYLDTKPLPWYGKSTLATAQDVALWGSAGLIAYGFAVYFAPREFEIPFTWKKHIAPAKKDPIANDPILLKEFKEWSAKHREKITDKTYDDEPMPEKFKALVPFDEKAKNDEIETPAWIDKDKTLIRWTANDLPLKSFFGDWSETKRSLIQQDSKELST